MARTGFESLKLAPIPAGQKTSVFTGDPTGKLRELEAKGQDCTEYSLEIFQLRLAWNLGTQMPTDAPDFFFDPAQMVQPGWNLGLQTNSYRNQGKILSFFNNEIFLCSILLFNIEGHNYLSTECLAAIGGIKQRLKVSRDFDLRISCSSPLALQDEIFISVEYEETFPQINQVASGGGGTADVDLTPVLEKFDSVIDLLSSPAPAPINDLDIVATLENAIALQVTLGSNWYLYRIGEQTWGWASDLGGGQGDLVIGPFDLNNKLIFLASGGFLTAGSQLSLKFELANGTEVMPATPLSNWMPTNPGAFVALQIDTSLYAGQTVRARFSDSSTQVIRLVGLVKVL